MVHIRWSLAGLGSVCIVKNCDFRLENAARGSIFNTSVTIFYYMDLSAGQ